MYFPNGVIIIHQASVKDIAPLDQLFNGELWLEVFLMASEGYMTALIPVKEAFKQT